MLATAEEVDITEQLNPVNWFEILVTDINKAKKFCETVLGIELTPAEMEPMKMTGFPMFEEGKGSGG